VKETRKQTVSKRNAIRLWMCPCIHVCISFLCAVGILLPVSREDIMSLMNTMCPSSVSDTFDTFIRS